MLVVAGGAATDRRTFGVIGETGRRGHVCVGIIELSHNFVDGDLLPGIRAIASWNLPPLYRRGGRPLKHKRFSDEQVIGVLKEHEGGGKVDDICRRHAISTATFYTWRKRYGGMEASDAKRRRELEAENAKLKRIVADQMLDMSAMKDLLGNHW